MASLREKRPGVWEVRVFAGRDPSGRVTHVSRTVRGGKRDAQRIGRELEKAPARSGGRSVADVLDAWFEAKEPGWAPYSARDHAARIKQLNKDPITAMPVARLGVVDVDGWMARKRKAGTGEASIRCQLQTLRAALQQGLRWGWLSANPAALVQGPGRGRPRDFMPDAIVHAMIEAAAEVHELAPLAFRVTASTGARRGEVAALRWVDLEPPVLRIDSAITKLHASETESGVPELIDRPTKTGDRRRLALDADTIAALEAVRAEREPHTAWMFSDDDGPPNPDKISWWWRRARTVAEVDDQWRFHDLRHWSASKALQSGHDVVSVARRLGHSTPNTTYRIYAHATEDIGEDLGATLGDALGSAGAQ